MNRNKTLFYLPFIGLILVYVLGMFVDVMDVDASQYATMGWEMITTKGYLQITDRYQAYLDKPPLLFWLTSVSYLLLGVSNFAFKLPSLVFALIAIYSTYKLCKLFYNETASQMAALIIASSQAVFLITNDCRTDTLLLGSVTMATYHLVKYIKFNQLVNLLWGFVAVGLAMLAKGPIGLMVPALAIGFDAVIKKNWSVIFKPQWLLGFVVVALMLAPMCWGLYEQHGMNGIKFFFWTQSFGRITGESIWHDDTTPLFFTHTFAWAILPWTVIFVLALFSSIKNAISTKFDSSEEYISLAGFLLPFIALSTSKYKLPHYIFIVLPFASILTARYLYEVFYEHRPIKSFIKKTQKSILVLLWIVVTVLTFWAFRTSYYWAFYSVALVVAIVAFVKMFQKDEMQQTIMSSVCMMIAVNILIGGHIYPTILTYQTTGEAGRTIKAHKADGDEIISLETSTNHSFDFYCRKIVNDYTTVASAVNAPELKGKSVWIYTTAQAKDSLSAQGVAFKQYYEGDDFNVSKLNINFINPAKRLTQTEKRYLIKAQF